jgi:hypothetical protein
MLVTFLAYKGRASCIFTCAACKKEKRIRTFTVEHTLNPYNRNDDGSPKTATDVLRDAQAAAKLECEQFQAYPLCKRCEDQRSWSEMKSIRARRLASSNTPQVRGADHG